MRGMILAIGAVVLFSTDIQAQQLQYRPIDTEALVVRPVDASTGIIGNTFRYVSRVTANIIENNGIVRTINNIFGRDAQPAAPQNGLSPLPQPGQYPSNRYYSPIQPVMPRYQTIRR